MQVIDTRSNNTRLAETLTSGFGTGLQQLAQNKLAQIQQQYNDAYNRTIYSQGAGQLFQSMGMPPEKAQQVAQAFSAISPQERQMYLQNPSAMMALLGQQQGGQPEQSVQPQLSAQMQSPMNMLAQQTQEPSSIVGPYSPYPQQQPAASVALPGQSNEPSARQKAIEEAFTSPALKRQNRMVELAEQKEGSRQQEKLKPFIEKMQNEDARWQTIRDKTSTALQLIEKAKAKFPGYFTGNVPESISSWVIRDPDVREYQGLINDLIPLLAAEPGQRLTNMQLKLKQMAKANVSQPIQTQVALLQGILDQSNLKKASTDYMESLKNQETGDFPKDLSSRVTEFRHAQEDPLKYPKYFQHNTIIEDDQGNIHMNVNGKRWQQLKR